MQRGTLETARDTGGALAEPELALPPPRLTDAAVHERFNLHASVHLAAHDDLARERLCRYLARPAFSVARSSGVVVRPRRGLLVARASRIAFAPRSMARPLAVLRSSVLPPGRASGVRARARVTAT
jgi:hypothetical protein